MVIPVTRSESISEDSPFMAATPEIEADLIIHVVHVAGKCMISQGMDDMSRGDKSTGVMQRVPMEKFVPCASALCFTSPLLVIGGYQGLGPYLPGAGRLVPSGSGSRYFCLAPCTCCRRRCCGTTRKGASQAPD